MAVRGDFRLTHPLKVEMTLTITMSMAEWKNIKQRLQPANSDGEWHLDVSINDMIDKADQVFNFYEQVGQTQ